MRREEMHVRITCPRLDCKTLIKRFLSSLACPMAIGIQHERSTPIEDGSSPVTGQNLDASDKASLIIPAVPASIGCQEGHNFFEFSQEMHPEEMGVKFIALYEHLYPETDLRIPITDQKDALEVAASIGERIKSALNDLDEICRIGQVPEENRGAIAGKRKRDYDRGAAVAIATAIRELCDQYRQAYAYTKIDDLRIRRLLPRDVEGKKVIEYIEWMYHFKEFLRITLEVMLGEVISRPMCRYDKILMEAINHKWEVKVETYKSKFPAAQVRAPASASASAAAPTQAPDSASASASPSAPTQVPVAAPAPAAPQASASASASASSSASASACAGQGMLALVRNKMPPGSAQQDQARQDQAKCM